MTAAVARTRNKAKKAKRVVTDVIIHIHASFNNTLITVSDPKGNVLSWATAGGCGYRGSRKSTPYAAGQAVHKALEKVKAQYSSENAEVRVYGPGPGRDASVRAARDHLHITAIYDVTGIPFNGCRPPNERRV
jgi:small subunit ribosomal protein S11